MRGEEPSFRVVTEPKGSSRGVTAYGTLNVRGAILLLRVIEFVTVERHREASVDLTHVTRVEPDAAELLAREWPRHCAPLCLPQG
jgi:hypothetical protein